MNLKFEVVLHRPHDELRVIPDPQAAVFGSPRRRDLFCLEVQSSEMEEVNGATSKKVKN
jgi:hypothetical protein